MGEGGPNTRKGRSYDCSGGGKERPILEMRKGFWSNRQSIEVSDPPSLQGRDYGLLHGTECSKGKCSKKGSEDNGTNTAPMVPRGGRGPYKKTSHDGTRGNEIKHKFTKGGSENTGGGEVDCGWGGMSRTESVYEGPSEAGSKLVYFDKGGGLKGGS